MKVGSSTIQKTNVRIVAATNVNMAEAIQKGKFREDLYYRLSTVEINLPPLRERNEDIHLLFRKFAADFAQKYKMPTIRLTDDALQLLLKYHWGGNIRQLRNVAEQISVLEQHREINSATLRGYLPDLGNNLPAVVGASKIESDFSTEREILYKVLFDLQRDVNDLKKLTLELLKSGNAESVQKEHSGLINKIYKPNDRVFEELMDVVEDTSDDETDRIEVIEVPVQNNYNGNGDKYHFAEEIEEEETLSLKDKELELIKKALEKNQGRRKAAAEELGLSERTLYRKIKQYNL